MQPGQVHDEESFLYHHCGVKMISKLSLAALVVFVALSATALPYMPKFGGKCLNLVQTQLSMIKWCIIWLYSGSLPEYHLIGHMAEAQSQGGVYENQLAAGNRQYS